MNVTNATGANRPRPPRLSRRAKEILSFLVDLGHGAGIQQFFDLFAIPRPVSPNERAKLGAILARLEDRGLLMRLPVPWHNGTTWILTDLGAAHGKRYAGELERTRQFLLQRDRVLQDDPLQPRPRILGGPPSPAPGGRA